MEDDVVFTDDNSSTTSSNGLQENDTRLIDHKFRKLYDSDPEFYDNFGYEILAIVPNLKY